MTNVYYAVVNSTSCIKKKKRRNKLRSILNPDLLIISFLKIKYTYVSILFIYYKTMHFYILLKRGKVNLTDVYNATVNYDIPNIHKNNLHMVLYKMDWLTLRLHYKRLSNLPFLVSREYKNALFYFKCEIKNKQPFENMCSKYIKDNFYLCIACFWIKNSNLGRFVYGT
jgi:hypothetical protein